MEALMTKTLDEQIEERKQEAAAKKLYIKAYVVAKKLGKGSFPDNDGSYTRTKHTFNDAANALVIRYELNERNDKDPEVPNEYDSVTISYNGKDVYKSSGDYPSFVDLYVPGPWEKQLDARYSAAQQIYEQERIAAAQKEAERKAAEEKAKRAKWGFDEASSGVAETRQPVLKKAALSVEETIAERLQRLKNAARPSRLVK
jgi:hypothetical protein